MPADARQEFYSNMSQGGADGGGQSDEDIIANAMEGGDPTKQEEGDDDRRPQGVRKDNNTPRQPQEIKKPEPKADAKDERPSSKKEEPKPEPTDEEPEVDESDNEPEGQEEPAEDEAEPEEAPEEIQGGRPALKDIKAKYPQIFKSFPGLKDIIYREQHYSNVFNSPNDAKIAAEDASILASLRDSIVDGDSVGFIKAIEQEGKDTLGKFATEVLPALYLINQDAYWDAVNPIMQRAARHMYKVGLEKGDTNLQYSAMHFAQLICGDQDVATGGKSIVDEARILANKAIREERARARADAETRFTQDVKATAVSQLKGEISKALANETDIPEFLLDNIVEQVFKSISDQMAADRGHMQRMDNLWRRATRTLSQADKTSITSAYLARAKQLITSERNKLLTRMRMKSPSATRNKLKDIQNRREPVQGGRSGTQPTRRLSSNNADYNNMSDEDIIMGNHKFKG